jgi:hypothetical protein
MLIFFYIVIIIILVLITVEDLAQMKIRLVWLLILAPLLLSTRLIENSFTNVMYNFGLNLAIVTLNIVISYIVIIISRRKILFILDIIGPADIIILALLALYFETLEFVMVFIGGLVFALIYAFFKKVLMGNIRKVPLAGIISIVFIAFVFFKLFNVNFPGKYLISYF